MSTRANIVFLYEGKGTSTDLEGLNDSCDAVLYNHSDGYPEGLGKLLIGFMKTEWFREWNDDPQYLAAMCLVYLYNERNNGNVSSWCGLGVSPCIDDMVYYIYVFNCATSVFTVFRKHVDRLEKIKEFTFNSE